MKHEEKGDQVKQKGDQVKHEENGDQVKHKHDNIDLEITSSVLLQIMNQFCHSTCTQFIDYGRVKLKDKLQESVFPFLHMKPVLNCDHKCITPSKQL